MEMHTKSAVELSSWIKKGKITVMDAVREAYEQIEREEELLHCFLTTDREEAMKEAWRIQKRIESGELSGRLAGVPYAVKDNICSKGMRTTCASRMLEHFVPAYDATVICRARDAGMLLIGKTNMDEFAFGSTTETSYFGPTRNPKNPDYVAGGSSGGSAAAVAAGECLLALGSDTGGSIRQPASYCGVVGLKPTYGSVSRYGLIAYASSMDQVGPIANCVEDCEAMFFVLAGQDERDGTSLPVKVSETAGDEKEWKIAYLGEDMDESVATMARKLRDYGMHVEKVDVSLISYAVCAYYTIACAEGSSNLERFDGIRYGYRREGVKDLQEFYCRSRSEGLGEEVRRRILLGTYVLNKGFYEEYYLRALRIRALVKQEFERIFKQFDVVLLPVTGQSAPKLGESLLHPIQMYESDKYTVLANLIGAPAISIPCGVDEKGLPLGIQLMADCFAEEKLFRVAKICEALGREVSSHEAV